MENASKALIMAAGVLIGLIIFAIFVYEFSYFAQHSRMYEEKLAQEQIIEFNEQFEKYTNKKITAQDVVTIYNLINEWNMNHDTDDVSITWGSTDLASGILNQEQFLYVYSMNQQKTFKCTINPNVPGTYDEWGRVRKIKIEVNS